MTAPVAVLPNAAPAARPLRGAHVIGGFVAFFVALAAIDAVLIFLAVSTFGGLETSDAYRKGLAYNATIAEAGAQAARGWSDVTAIDRTTGALETEIRDRDGHGVINLAVVARIGRAATNSFDRTIVLEPVGAGRYAAPVADLAAGGWIAAIEARSTGRTERPVVYRSKARVWRQP